MPKRYPEVMLTELDFEQLLDLVEACDQQQLLRLYCKVGAVINGDWDSIAGSQVDHPTPLPPVLELDESDLEDYTIDLTTD